jgi:[acyl-carrier-protein] S-malonyltransferase
LKDYFNVLPTLARLAMPPVELSRIVHMATRAFLFPGQGSQAVGMGAALMAASPAARAAFEEVDEALQQNLSKLMRDGPIETLTLTANAQPAIMASSLAIVRVLEQEANILLSSACAYVAGHSLGEYSALCAAGSLTLSDTACLLRIRGDAMQAAVPVGVGAMAALLGVDMAEAQNICDLAAQGPAGQTDVCAPANDNAPGQIVISGHKAAVERAIALAKERGKKAMNLPVSAPFHCTLMQPAADAMASALARTSITAPFLPVMANVSAHSVSDAAQIRTNLVEQVTGQVRWRESIEALVALGVDTMVEIGTGKALAGMVKRINRDVTMINIESADDIDAFLKTL